MNRERSRPSSEGNSSRESRVVRSSINGLVIAGTVLIAAGLVGFAVPIFTTQHTTEVARIGDLKLEATESKSYVVPPLLSGSVLVAGAILLGAAFFRRR